MAQHLNLFWQLTKREVIGRYKGSYLGIFWSLLTPLIMLAIYGFVFSIVFQAKWGAEIDAKGEFAVIIFSGLIIHNIFSECLNKAPILVTGNPNFVTKILFPIEIFVPVTIASSLFHFMVSFLVLLLGKMLIFGTISLHALLFPLVIIPYIAIIAGISWFIASLGVFFRDISQIMNIATAMLLFLSPVFYPIDAVSEKLRFLLYLNPLTFIIEQFRLLVIWGKMPDFMGLGIYMLVGIILSYLGFYFFKKTKKAFADIL